MNKQEAIEQIKQETYHHCGEKECYKDGCKRYVESDIAIGIINQIDEPQKITIPKFVAEWLEECKSRNLSVGQAIEIVNSKEQEEIFDWFWDKGFRDNQLQFARAWLDGYDIEQEKLYYVSLPNPNLDGKGHGKFMLEKRGEKIYLVKRKSKEVYQNKLNQRLTEAEIKKDFEWAWQFAEPVEEE